MFTDITFNPIIKYLIIFIISFMFLNQMKYGQYQVVMTSSFIIILVIVIDIFHFADYEDLIDVFHHDE